MSVNKYSFPEVFVRNQHGDKYIVRRGDEYLLVEDKNIVASSSEFYGHVMYEDVVEKAIDLIEPLITRDIIIIPRYTNEEFMNGLLVKNNTKPCLIEIKGSSPIIFINEDEIIDYEDKIAYIVTGKREVRTVKSPCKGRVVLVVNFPWEKPERYLVVVVRPDEVREIRIRKSS